MFKYQTKFPGEPMPQPGELDPTPRYWQQEAQALREAVETEVIAVREKLGLEVEGQGAEKAQLLLPSFAAYFDFILGWLEKKGQGIESEPIDSLRNSQLEMLLDDVLNELVAIRSNLHSTTVNTTKEFDHSTQLPDLINQKTAEVAAKLVDIGVAEDDLGQFRVFLEEQVENLPVKSEALNNQSESGKISSSLTPEESSGSDLLIPLEEYES
ncbi:hypothetical protein KC644_00200 [Candidatus Berkelbacteria bacterium]|nr:hypothetical protein [Candidatus Berkelbacteria bacterium]